MKKHRQCRLPYIDDILTAMEQTQL